ncbi:MAG TPA: 50S ribosomal protein L30 [Gammaproteobacteria bacterium]|nr:50S ribosomal protein L30 [Gammaproteobacteria bacterium]
MAKNKDKHIKVTLVRSPFGRLRNHRDCVRGLGLRRLHHSVSVQDTPQVRGLIEKVSYLLRVEES